MTLYGAAIESFQERFWSKVNKEDDCWLWTGYLKPKGYGSFQIGRKPAVAHRLSLEMTLGRHIPHGIDACHTCRNRHCVNPAHLYEGTRVENQADRIRDGTSNRGIRNPQSKLTEEQVRSIKQDTRIQTVIAADYNCSVSSVNDIKHGRTWGWLTS